MVVFVKSPEVFKVEHSVFEIGIEVYNKTENNKEKNIGKNRTSKETFFYFPDIVSTFALFVL
jgi:hypothetical protein